jgi:lactoylglutathione lyase
LLIPLHGVFEAHLNVSKLHRALAFYNGVLGLPLAASFPERRVSFVWVGDPGQSMLGLWEVGTSPQKSLSHVALRISRSDLPKALVELHEAGVQALDFEGKPADAPVVLAWMPAAAIYFRDPDDNLLELIAMLPDPPRPTLGVVSWRDWIHRSPESELVNQPILPIPAIGSLLQKMPYGREQ